MLFLRRWLKRLLIWGLAVFVAQRLLEASDPRAQRVGRTIDRFTGGRAARRLERR